MTISKSLSLRNLNMKILRFPRLSPSMSEGRIVKWLLPEYKKSVQVESYQLICKIACKNLTAPENQITSVNKEDVLDIEILEDGFLLNVLHIDEDENIKVDEPIAIIVDEEQEIVDNLLSKEDFIDNIALEDYPSALWQAYLDSSITENGNCN